MSTKDKVTNSLHRLLLRSLVSAPDTEATKQPIGQRWRQDQKLVDRATAYYRQHPPCLGGDTCTVSIGRDNGVVSFAGPLVPPSAIGHPGLSIPCPIIDPAQQCKAHRDLRAAYVEAERAEGQASWAKTTAALGIPARYAQVSWFDADVAASEYWPADTSQPTAAMTAVRAFVVDGSDDDDTYFEKVARVGRALVLLGDTGAGKTYAAVWALRAAHLDDYGNTVGQFLDMGSVAAVDFDERAKRAAWAKHRGLLVLDDVKVDTLRQPFVRELIEGLLLYRHAHRLPTILTSNATEGELLAALGDRIASRFREWATVVMCLDPDMRTEERA